MTDRIRWEPNGEGGAFFGYVGTLGKVFEICYAGAGAGNWRLTSGLSGQLRWEVFRDDPDALKAEAERWLEQFAASLGAVFPPDPQQGGS
jgi:hypothetical protein